MLKYLFDIVHGTYTQLRSLVMVFSHAFRKRDTLQYPEEPVYLPPRYRGRIVLTRDPDGEERCVACNLCAVACPVGCISLQKAEHKDGRWYPEFFRINFSRCIFCGLCEEACPTTAIQLTPDFELGEFKRQDLVYEKEDLLISGPGKYPEYNFYRMAGMAVDGKSKGEAENEAKPINVKFHACGSLRQQTFDVDRFGFVFGFAFRLAVNCHTGHPVEVIFRIFTRTRDQQIFFFVHQILTFELTKLKVRRQLNGRRRAGFFTQTAENTAREVDTEKLRIPTTVFMFRFLQ